jgi:protein-disulfide isomerase
VLTAATARAILACGALLLGPALAPTQAAAADEAAITSAQANEIISELRAIPQLLEKSAPAAAPVDAHISMTLGDSPVLGSADAPLTLVEFADFQCPFCRRFHTSVFEDIKKNFVDTGKLRYVSRDLPLPMHDHATQAANAARCAGDQDQFWAMRHVLIVNSQKLEHDDLLTYAHDLHLNKAASGAVSMKTNTMQLCRRMRPSRHRSVSQGRPHLCSARRSRRAVSRARKSSVHGPTRCSRRRFAPCRIPID